MRYQVNIGDKYNHLTVIQYNRYAQHAHYYTCECVCGKHVNVRAVDLYDNTITNCGCIKNDWLKAEKFENFISSFYDENLSVIEMSVMSGLSVNYIRRILCKYNLPYRYECLKDTGRKQWLAANSKLISHDDKPYADSESLYCDKEFLEELIHKEIGDIH